MSTELKRSIKYILIVFLNIFDYAITTYWTGLHGLQTEINPVMRVALSTPRAFEVVKLILFPILLIWMWRKHHEDSAWFALGAFTAVAMLNINTIFGG